MQHKKFSDEELRKAYKAARKPQKIDSFPYVFFSKDELLRLLEGENCKGIKFYPAIVKNDDGKEQTNLLAKSVTETPSDQIGARAALSASAAGTLSGTSYPIGTTLQGHQPCPDECDDDK